ncbi:MAG: ABC transporter permease [Blastocatellia bacterium]
MHRSKYLYWRERSQSFESLTCYSGFGGARGNLAGGHETEYVRGLRVSASFFRVFGVQPAQGRGFTAEEDTPGAARVALISDGLWQRQFGGRQDLIGQTLRFNDEPLTVVGVMPPEFRFGGGADLFVPLQARAGAHVNPNSEVVGRLKPGVTIDQARAELKAIADQYRQEFPRAMQDGESIAAHPYQAMFTDRLRGYMWILLGAVGFLLLIACVNVANLQLARAAARQREIAVRRAMGAGSARIARQLLTEGVLLAMIGGAAGALLAVWGTEALAPALPEDLLPGLVEIKVDWRVWTFAFLAPIVAGLLAGTAPAWQALKVDVNTSLKENAGRGGAARGRLRGVLVVSEVALSLVLLIGAGLLAQTFMRLLGVAPGFDPRHVTTFQIVLDGPRYDTTQEVAAFYRDALKRISHLPGVEAAAVTNKLPMDWQYNTAFRFSDQPDKIQSVQFRAITADYFRVMKIGVLQGREFTAADGPGAQSVAMVNEAFVRRYFTGQNPFARQLSIGGQNSNDPARQVIGVIADARQQGLDSDPPPTLFVPAAQLPDQQTASVRTFNPSNFAIRTIPERAGLIPEIKRELAGLDAGLAISQVRSMDDLVGRAVAPQRFNMLLVGLFAGLGLALAAVGIYGVMSQTVAQRVNEIGIRMALGATADNVVSLMLRHGLTLALTGVAIGLAAAFGLTRLIKGLLYGVEATDPLTFASIALLLFLVALAACWIPARRAARVDPLTALRNE